MADAKRLFQLGCPVDMEDGHGNTALHIAVQNGHIELVNLCCEVYGANVNHQNHEGQTALHFAHFYGHDDIFQFLKMKEADDTVKNMSGKTCYEGLD